MPCAPHPQAFVALVASAALTACAAHAPSERERADDAPYVLVLGTAQDAGRPQAGCRKPCCAGGAESPERRRYAASVAIVDPATERRWLVDCGPDVREQLALLDAAAPFARGADGLPPGDVALDGVFVTHAHLGHYTGLLHLGREASGSDAVPVHAMPRMRALLTTQAPWSLLVEAGHARLEPLEADRPVELGGGLRVVPLVVPHRDEFSETVAFRIEGSGASVLYLPDVDKWERWDTGGARRIEAELARVDAALLDGTFFDGDELPGRDMASIPHPFVAESLARFAALPASERAKVWFVHLNHTNPALDADSDASRAVEAAGHGVARRGQRFGLGG